MGETQSDIERQAREFIEENEPLLNEGSLPALQRMFVHGSKIAVDLSAESVEAANRATAATRALTAAIKDRSTSPRKIQELETERARLTEIHDHKSGPFQQFSDFMDRVIGARRRKEDEQT